MSIRRAWNRETCQRSVIAQTRIGLDRSKPCIASSTPSCSLALLLRLEYAPPLEPRRHLGQPSRRLLDQDRSTRLSRPVRMSATDRYKQDAHERLAAAAGRSRRLGAIRIRASARDHSDREQLQRRAIERDHGQRRHLSDFRPRGRDRGRASVGRHRLHTRPEQESPTVN